MFSAGWYLTSPPGEAPDSRGSPPYYSTSPGTCRDPSSVCPSCPPRRPRALPGQRACVTAIPVASAPSRPQGKCVEFTNESSLRPGAREKSPLSFYRGSQEKQEATESVGLGATEDGSGYWERIQAPSGAGEGLRRAWVGGTFSQPLRGDPTETRCPLAAPTVGKKDSRAFPPTRSCLQPERPHHQYF